MSELLSCLKQEELRLQSLQKEIKSRIKEAPKGIIRTSISHGKPQYYYCKTKKSKKKYIKKKDLDFAVRVAQNQYDLKVIRVLERKLRWTKRMQAYLQNDEEEQTFARLPENIKPLIKPTKVQIKDLINQWNSFTYVGKSFAEDVPEIITDKGERVRSKSEKIIADKLAHKEIPYHYEVPLKLDAFKTVYPDFYVLNSKNGRSYYWEHFGMMDDEMYASKAVQKLNTYVRNGLLPGIQLIVTFETSECPLDTRLLDRIIEHYL